MARWIKVQSVQVSHKEIDETFVVEVMYNGPTKDKPTEGGEVRIKFPKKEEWIDVPSYIDPEIFGFSPRRAPYEAIGYLKKNLCISPFFEFTVL